ncbi:purine-binding chemotaxis protein CheW [Pontibacter sp. BT310]|uniref:Chemotaxis protein CheW n=1 Tax=Pontibacter populi TaxID=890055 RepID=A0ABS6XG90_9BACT|nr:MULTISPECIES: chemotaxis protein CheW [Pontibacter]MBJ6119690.1 purine-binding chemotaxis protein CheW [Pontibacter sp. BT310]MBR0572119.1 purine-binding chemotaxis protein CheW [Microvirga sp. STS03]MBW3366543.1 chemotaxis protein CheW [Pontibacter populi]
MPTKKGRTPETSEAPEEVSAVSGNGKEESAKVKTNEPLLHLIVFKLGAEFYGIKIEQVKEVTVTPTITRMPRTPDFVKGVANIRGDIIAIMDLEERFGIRPDTSTSTNNSSYTLVIEAREYSIGVVVKEVPQSLNLTVSKMDKTPSFLQDIAVQENYIEGIAKVDNRLIIVLDMYKILSGDEIKQLSN